MLGAAASFALDGGHGLGGPAVQSGGRGRGSQWQRRLSGAWQATAAGRWGGALCMQGACVGRGPRHVRVILWRCHKVTWSGCCEGRRPLSPNRPARPSRPCSDSPSFLPHRRQPVAWLFDSPNMGLQRYHAIEGQPLCKGGPLGRGSRFPQGFGPAERRKRGVSPGLLPPQERVGSLRRASPLQYYVQSVDSTHRDSGRIHLSHSQDARPGRSREE